jgi:hypothetical protein
MRIILSSQVCKWGGICAPLHADVDDAYEDRILLKALVLDKFEDFGSFGTRSVVTHLAENIIKVK